MSSAVSEPNPTPATSVSTLLGDTALQAAALPGRVALLWEDGQRTYAELRDNALRLASALRVSLRAMARRACDWATSVRVRSPIS